MACTGARTRGAECRPCLRGGSMLMMRFEACGRRLGFVASLLLAASCSDSKDQGMMPNHLPGPGDLVDAAAAGDGPAGDAQAADGAMPGTCGASGVEVIPLPASGQVSAPAPIGAGQFMGTCGGQGGGEVIYLVP